MKFFTHKRNLPTVPLISLIDILAILLIFFIATTTFKKRESLIKINLPKSAEMTASSEKIIRVALSLTADNEIFLDGKPIPIEDLADALRLFQAADPEAKLEIKPDLEADVGLLFEIWDAAKKAGIDIDKLPVRYLLEGRAK